MALLSTVERFVFVHSLLAYKCALCAVCMRTNPCDKKICFWCLNLKQKDRKEGGFNISTSIHPSIYLTMDRPINGWNGWIVNPLFYEILISCHGLLHRDLLPICLGSEAGRWSATGCEFHVQRSQGCMINMIIIRISLCLWLGLWLCLW